MAPGRGGAAPLPACCAARPRPPVRGQALSPPSVAPLSSALTSPALTQQNEPRPCERRLCNQKPGSLSVFKLPLTRHQPPLVRFSGRAEASRHPRIKKRSMPRTSNFRFWTLARTCSRVNPIPKRSPCAGLQASTFKNVALASVFKRINNALRGCSERFLQSAKVHGWGKPKNRATAR